MTNSIIITNGSCDAIMATSAYILENNLKDIEVKIEQPHTLTNKTLEGYENIKITLVDLGVNNRDKETTISFVEEVRKRNCTIKSIIDEHSAEDWKSILTTKEWSQLEIKPVTQSDDSIQSSCCILKQQDYKNPLVLKYLEIGRKADNWKRPEFVEQGEIVNKVIKDDLFNNNNRLLLIKWLVNGGDINSHNFNKEIRSYDKKIKRTKELLTTKKEINIKEVTVLPSKLLNNLTNNNISLITVLSDEILQETELLVEMYKSTPIAIIEYPSKIVIGTNSPDIDLKSLASDIKCYGFAKKITILKD